MLLVTVIFPVVVTGLDVPVNLLAYRNPSEPFGWNSFFGDRLLVTS